MGKPGLRDFIAVRGDGKEGPPYPERFPDWGGVVNRSGGWWLMLTSPIRIAASQSLRSWFRIHQRGGARRDVLAGLHVGPKRHGDQASTRIFAPSMWRTQVSRTGCAMRHRVERRWPLWAHRVNAGGAVVLGARLHVWHRSDQSKDGRAGMCGSGPSRSRFQNLSAVCFRWAARAGRGSCGEVLGAGSRTYRQFASAGPPERVMAVLGLVPSHPSRV